MLFMIISDIYNLMDNTFIDKLYQFQYNLETYLQNNDRIINEIETTLDNLNKTD
jgi:hypothetical protein